jgi:hypothetical protein
MKNLFFFFILSSFTLYLTSCEKAEPEQVAASDHAMHEKLGKRSPDCSECDPQDCCCFVELNGASLAELAFCGTTNPDISTNVCGPINLDDCPTINGFYWTESLGSGDPNEFFCVTPGTSFMLAAGPSTGTSIRFTCQYGQISPQIITLSLSAGEKRYYTVDGCTISECHVE